MKIKKVIIICIIVFILVYFSPLFFSLLEKKPSSDITCFLYLESFEGIPKNYTALNTTDLQQYPMILEGIGNVSIKGKCKELDIFLDLINYPTFRYIKYNDTYYYVSYTTP